MKKEESFQIFKNKNVLITGHTGFKGSWLTIWLNELGANVVGYALDPYTPQDNFVLTKLSEIIIDNRGDIRDYENLESVIKKYKPDIVFHLAAQSLVGESYLNPKETFDINIGGTVNLLEICRNSKSIKVIVNITSDKCYENKGWIWGYRESDPMGGHDPYSASKGCSELITASYRNSFFKSSDYQKHGKSLSSVRAGNVIGGGDWANYRIVPDCIKAIERNESILVRNPQTIRPWQYVLEPLSGYLFLASKMYVKPDEYFGAWNFGPEDSSVVTVGELADQVIKKYGKGSWHIGSLSNDFHETSLLTLDINKAVFKIGWKPRLCFTEAVEYTIEWYKNYKEKEDMYDFCVQQIERYICEE